MVVTTPLRGSNQPEAEVTANAVIDMFPAGLGLAKASPCIAYNVLGGRPHG